MSRVQTVVPPLAVLAAGVAMAALTWGTWPDPLYDFGTHLYVPWRITAGQRLYADVAYFYGPLSPHVNAALFRLFGVGLWTLAWANLAVLAGVLAMVGRLAGWAAAGVVVGAFAFGRYVGIGNYNWACPYCHEVTHGVALGLAAVLAVGRFAQTRRARWLAVAGVAVGLCLLTKPEIAGPAVVAVVVGVWLVEAPDVHPGLRWGAVVAPAVGVVLVTFALLAVHAGVDAAMAGLVGPWRWVFDPRVAGLAFYRQGMGTDDVGGNLARMAGVLAITAVAATGGWLAGWRRWRGPALAMAALGGGGLAWAAFDVARPWPVLVGAVVVVSVRRGRSAEWVARATLAVFALGLLAKMALAARVYQYGFALAMPAAAVLTDAAVRWGPAAIAARGGSAGWPRAVAILIIAVLVAIHVGRTVSLTSNMRTAVGAGADRFWSDRRGAEVMAAVAAVRSADTVVVAPQGLMVNYLARRPDPLTVVNLMPPELASVGEDAVLAQLRRRPPAAVVLVGVDIADGGLVLTEGHHVYGRAILAWVRSAYAADPTFVPAGPSELSVWRRR